MRVLIGHDPGKHEAGIAVFDLDAKRLLACEVLRARESEDRAPITYRQGKFKAPECALPYLIASHALIVCSPYMQAGRLPFGSEFVSETPRVYDKKKSKVNPEHLFSLSTCHAAVATMLHPTSTRLVVPSEWKHQIPDNILWDRIRSRLAPDELTIAQAMEARSGAHFHHALEAIGVGLWALWRL